MGLTIHYKIKTKKKTENLLKCLENVRQECLDLAFEEVDKIEHTLYKPSDIAFFHMLQKKYSYPNNTTENLAKRDKAIKDRGLDLWTLIGISCGKPIQGNVEVITWGVWAGRGCEGTAITFTRESGKNKPFVCDSFTKTQYATQFVKCHLLVVKLFDLLKEQGFAVEVKDEGNYWETRDLEVLAKEINDYTILIKSVLGTVQEIAKNNGLSVETPITECENYVKINKKK